MRWMALGRNALSVAAISRGVTTVWTIGTTFVLCGLTITLNGKTSSFTPPTEPGR